MAWLEPTSEAQGQNTDGGGSGAGAGDTAEGARPDDTHEQAPVELIVEVRLRDGTTVGAAEAKAVVERLLSERCITHDDGALDLTVDTRPDTAAWLQEHVQCVRITDTSQETFPIGRTLMPWQFQPQVHVYQAVDDVAEDDEGEDGVPSYRETLLPANSLDGMWQALHFDSAVKQRLLRYTASALLFSDAGVDASLVSCNRVVLLHGPPGTGKTSLCRALANQLAIRLSGRYSAASLVEVNAHSLFSKWFSESGKQVSKLFSKIQELVEDPDMLSFVLIDEVESLAWARRAGAGEPSDAVRAVNALLTQLDGLTRFPNALVLTTSNITGAIDLAFLDRADIKAHIGPPSLAARYEMLRTSLQELCRAGLVDGSQAGLLWPFSRLQGPVLGLMPIASRDGTAPVFLTSTAASTPPLATLEVPGCGRDSVRLLLGYPTPDPEEEPALALSAALVHLAERCAGLSGRSLRRLPFLAHALHGGLPQPCLMRRYIQAVAAAAQQEAADRETLALT